MYQNKNLLFHYSEGEQTRFKSVKTEHKPSQAIQMSGKTDGIKEAVHRSYTSQPKYSEIVPGVPEDYRQIHTLGQLLELSYKDASVEEQMRGNLIAKRKRNEEPYPGIIGYDEDVVPATDRAILSGHDIIYIGEIGQAKTKLAETIAKNLLSPIPSIKGCVIHDIPTSLPEDEMISLLAGEDSVRTSPEFNVCNECEQKIKDDKLDTEIQWVDGIDRYRYVLATPDISVKDLVGQIDAIKIAKKGVEIYSIESYSPGQLLQSRHGVLCIDELPVLDPRKQVALLSVLQEGKFTTGAYPVIFKPESRIIATANPIDYTHSGKIIEPLFDRLRSHIDTHYPRTVEQEMVIMVQEAKINDGKAFLPIFMLKTLARITHMAREHPDVNKDKGVSVRMSIHGLELLLGEAFRTRALYHDVRAIPRPCDMYSIHQASKFELSEVEDNRENRIRVLNMLIEEALKQTALEYISGLNPDQLAKIKTEFVKNKTFEASQNVLGGNSGSTDYANQLEKFPTLKQVVNDVLQMVKKDQEAFAESIKKYNIDSAIITVKDNMNGEFTASVAEIVLEGLRWPKPPVVDKKEKGYVST
ncbi:MAG: magnesium chelatase subunit I [Candidatus Nitrosomirales archaeon]|jgi:magnesium chelatase subunit I